MTISVTAAPEEAWKFSLSVYIGFATLAALLLWLFHPALEKAILPWLDTEEYSHGFFIPIITVYFIWQKQHMLARIPFEGSYAGMSALLLALAMYFVGELSALYIIVQYSFVLALMGIVLAVAGWRIFKEVWIPLLFLVFCIPLPQFLYHGLSAKLQLLSSQLGVSFIRFCDISVFLEGNVIDLGTMRLQVAEACNGLRYLFPLASIAFICAYFFQASFWKRALVFLSSLPITLLMNSLRIGVIGVLVEYWGKSMAEGFLHDFEGWAVFMGCTAILLGEMWLLAKIGHDPRPLREVFSLTFPEPWPKDMRFRDRRLPRQFWGVAGLLVATGIATPLLEQREEVVPARTRFAEFPMRLGAWSGRPEIMDKEYVDALKFEDYLLANFSRAGAAVPVNVYSAYYASQRKGESIHSPRTCLPGGGWEMQSLDTVVPPGLASAANGLKVNRVVIAKGNAKQLVYYWFRQRGRDMTGEYSAKFFLLWDALAKNRSDGALIRLTTAVEAGDVAAADRRLTDFIKVAEPEFHRFIAD